MMLELTLDRIIRPQEVICQGRIDRRIRAMQDRLPAAETRARTQSWAGFCLIHGRSFKSIWIELEHDKELASYAVSDVNEAQRHGEQQTDLIKQPDELPRLEDPAMTEP